VYVDPNTGGVQAGLMNFRNGIINGDFDVWQRGTTFNAVATAAFTADRWQVVYDGSGATRAITQQAFSVGQTDVQNNPKFWLRFATSVAGTGATFVCITQKIEGVRSFAGKNISVSFWAKAISSINLFGTIQQVFGTGGSPSSVVQINAFSTQVINTSWQRYSATIYIPSISGKTIGTNNDDYLNILFALPINATFTFDLAQVQVEEGQLVTPFEIRPLSVELQLCYRYYYRIGTTLGNFNTIVASGHMRDTISCDAMVTLPCVMRKMPTGGKGTTELIIYAGNGNPFTTGAYNINVSLNNNSIWVRFNAGTAQTMGYGAIVVTNGQNSYMDFNAEL